MSTRRRRSTTRIAGAAAAAMALALAVPVTAQAEEPADTLDDWRLICSVEAPRVDALVTLRGRGADHQGLAPLRISLYPEGSAPGEEWSNFADLSETVESPGSYFATLAIPPARWSRDRTMLINLWTSEQYPAFIDASSDCYTPFTDVPVDYVFIDPIIWMSDYGISRGYDLGDATYAYDPFGAVNRDQMAAFLYRLAGEPAYTPPSTSPFRDVPTGYVFYKEIAWLYEHGISNGWDVPGGREYRPFEAIKRDQMAAFLYRFAGEPAYSLPSSTGFTDVARGRVFAKEIAWLKSTGLANGWSVPGGAEYRPFSNILRDQMAAFLYRFAGTFGE